MKLSELVEAQRVISDVAMMLDHHGEHETADRLQAVAERLRAAGNGAAAVPEGWISVEDHMPPEGETVLVYAPSDAFKFAFDTWQMQREAPVSFSAVTVETGLMWDDHEFEEITHWMPLPAAPAANAQPAEPVAQAAQQPIPTEHCKRRSVCSKDQFCDDPAHCGSMMPSHPAAEPAQQPQEALPTLPEPAMPDIKRQLVGFFTAEQMRDYARLCRSRAPVPEAGLTDEQIEEIWQSLWGHSYSTEIRRRKFARAILAAAKEPR